jgi:hypothetical protein
LNWFHKYWAIIVASVTVAGTIAVALHRTEAHEKHLQKIEKDGSEYARETRWKVAAQERDIEDLKHASRRTAENIAEMTIHLRLVAEYIQEQKEAKRRATGAP